MPLQAIPEERVQPGVDRGEARDHEQPTFRVSAVGSIAWQSTAAGGTYKNTLAAFQTVLC
jgi:hypothetical protein